MESRRDLGARMGRLAEGLAVIDPHAAEASTLERGLRSVARLRSFCDAIEAGLTPALEALLRNPPRSLDRSDSSDTSGSPDTADPFGSATPASPEVLGVGEDPSEPGLADVPRESADELARRLARATWLGRCERFADALLTGTIKGEHIDALAAVLRDIEPWVVADVLAEEERLLEVARRVGHVAFGRYVRDVVDRVRADGGMRRFERQIKDTFASCKLDEVTGMYSLYGRLDPIRGAEIAAALQHRVDAMYQTAGATTNLSYGQVVANALHALLTGAAPAQSSGPSLLIVADARSVVDGEHRHTVCETADGAPIPVDIARSLLADALVTVAIADAGGQVLHLGRSQRLASSAQRLAVRAMYRQCGFPGCRVPEPQCHVHHVAFWEDGGTTDLANLLPLCRRHHHLVHDAGWRLTVDRDRTVRSYRPGGSLDTAEPFAPRIRPPTAPSVAPATAEPPDAPSEPPGVTDAHRRPPERRPHRPPASRPPDDDPPRRVGTAA